MDVKLNAKLKQSPNLNADFNSTENLNAGFGNTQIIPTGNYNDLGNKPSINEVELKGNKTFEELGDHLLTNIEIKQIFDRVFKGGQ